tara:strand:+ start:280 stop:1098 length:819 start_codon:yes stop_codon:yes gene_type:complete
MSNIELYQPLLELSAAISESNQELQDKPGWKRKSELKKAIQNMEEKLTEETNELINRTVDSWDSDQPLSEFLVAELDAIREAADDSWHVAIDDVKARLSKLANKEGRKSPLRRKIEKNGWWITILVIGVIMVSLKWYWFVDVNKPMDEPAGVIQRAAALEKLLDYDDSMDTKVRRGGWLKGILFWPAEPTEEESKYASEFLWTSVDVYDYLKKQNALCSANLSHNSNDENYKDEIAIAQVAIDYINNTPNASGAESGPLLLAGAYTTKFPCQ